MPWYTSFVPLALVLVVNMVKEGCAPAGLPSAARACLL